MNKVFLLFVLFGLISCSSRLVVTPRKCPTRAIWSAYEDLELLGKETYWILGSEKKVFVRDMLKENGVKCSQLKTLKLTIKREWSDTLFSLIPFVARRTLVVEGLKNK